MLDFKRSLFCTLAFFAVIFVAGQGFQFACDKIENHLDPIVPNVFLKRRWKDFESKLPAIDFTGKTVIVFFGSSEVEMGVDPTQILPMVKKENLEGLNLGFRLVPGDAIPVLLERTIREVFAMGAKKIILVMKLPVYSLTTQAEATARMSEADDVVRTIADFQTVKSYFLNSPIEGANFFIKQALLGGAGSSSFGYFLDFRGEPWKVRPQSFFHKIVGAKELLQSGHWPLKTRGKMLWEKLFESHPQLANETNLRQLNPDELRLMQRLRGFLAPKFAPTAERILNKIASITKKYGVPTIVFDFPDLLTVEKVREKGAEEKIGSLTLEGVEILQAPYENLGKTHTLDRSDYFDSMHLNTKGEEKLWPFLAALIRKQLQ